MNTGIQLLNLLKNQIDIARVPFSTRGSRLLLYQEAGKSRLFVKLAERLVSLDPDPEAYVRRPAFIHSIEFMDEAGTSLEFEITTSPDILCFQSRSGEFRVTFQEMNVIAISLPPGRISGIKFQINSGIWTRNDQGGEIRSVRNFAYRTNSRVLTNHAIPTADGHLVEFLVRANDDPIVTFHISDASDLTHESLSFSQVSAQARLRWQKWFDQVPPVAEVLCQTYAYAWWVLGCNLLSPLGHLGFECAAPSKSTYIGIWLWDSAFHSIAYRHIDPELARNQIRTMLAHQLQNGMLPDAIHDEGIVTEIDHPFQAEVTKPPLLAWAAMKIYGIAPDLGFLREIYGPLVRCNAWWFEMNDDDRDGLAQYNHPYSSGLDDSPLWDYGMPVESPDLNTYLCIQMQSLAEMAGILGMSGEAARWRDRAAVIVQRMIEDLWDEESGLFRAVHDEKPIPVATPFNLLPLWTNALPDEMRSRLIAHIKNPDEFWGEYPLPTVARNHPDYDPETMWRGPVWANINYLIIEALHRCGEEKLSKEIREKTLGLIMRQVGIFEYYNAETGKPPLKAGGMFSWTAAVFIDLALQAGSS